MSETLSRLEGLKAVAGYYKAADVPGVELAPGVTLRFIGGEQLLMSVVTIEPGAIVPPHSHPHEQCGTVLEGELLLYMNGTEPENGKVLKPGDYWVIPGGVSHSAKSANGQPVVALDIFGPPREDYLEAFRQKYGREVPGLTRQE